MSGLEFAAKIVNSLAWPAVVVAVILLRRELADIFLGFRASNSLAGRLRSPSLECEKMVAAVAKETGTP